MRAFIKLHRAGFPAARRHSVKSTTLHLAPKASPDPVRIQLFQALSLQKFSDEEILRSYQLLYGAGCGGSGSSVPPLDSEELKRLVRANNLSKDDGSDYTPSKEEWIKKIKALGEELDPRVYPLGLSFLGTGLSIGIIVPVLPLLVETLKISPSQFGIVVSAFGLAKLVGNIPAARWVEDFGRKHVMVGGMALCSIGIGSIGLSIDPTFGAPSLIVSRLVTGFGVSAFTSAAFMMLSDISTSLNRTRTMSPVMASFQAGTALGPAIGGLAVTHLGIANSYFAVGGMISALALGNHFMLRESKPSSVVTVPNATASPSSVLQEEHQTQTQTQTRSLTQERQSSFALAMNSWSSLVKQKPMRDVVLANTVYWIGLSGTSLTLLPLFMVGPDLHLTATQIGICFAFQSSVSVAASQPVAYLADKWGKEKCIALGLGVLGGSMIGLPVAATSFESLLLMLAPIALGSTCLSAVPAALVGDIVEPSQRSQALALLRTAGDVGLLVGAIFSGMVSSASSLGLTMEVNGALLLASGAVWGARRFGKST